jgi:acyl-coenzyme A thioesterase PaaI-like protein
MFSGTILRKLVDRTPMWMLRRVGNLWAPFLGAGIKVEYISRDFREIRVLLHERVSNRNYVGTHFGGSIYAMVDPFYMLMIMQNLGRGYIVWDKAAEIEFIKPGKGTLHATFRLTDAQMDALRRSVDKAGKVLADYVVEVVDNAGDTVAKVNKTIYIRCKDHVKSAKKNAAPRRAKMKKSGKYLLRPSS